MPISLPGRRRRRTGYVLLRLLVLTPGTLFGFASFGGLGERKIILLGVLKIVMHAKAR